MSAHPHLVLAGLVILAFALSTLVVFLAATPRDYHIRKHHALARAAHGDQVARLPPKRQKVARRHHELAVAQMTQKSLHLAGKRSSLERILAVVQKAKRR